MSTRDHLSFILNDDLVHVDDAKADDMLLDFIREKRRLTGTKEGCNEGDCGACTILLGDLEQGQMRYRPVNACIRPLASVDACHVVTVEHLRGAEGGLHPVQQAMVTHHGSQCGFCTPGIVMSLAARWMAPDEAPDAITALQGNLCRCTGYAPILRAAAAADEVARDGDPVLAGAEDVAARLRLLQGDRVEIVGPDGPEITLPADLDDLAQTAADHPEATLVAGATDVGLWVTKRLRQIRPAIHLGHLPELQTIELRDGQLHLGAGVTYEAAKEVLSHHFPLADYWSRIGGWQVRASGTLGGNIANGSPIGDTPPLWIALGATLHLRHGAASRHVLLEDYFIEYGRQDRKPGEIVTGLTVPLLNANTRLAAYKVSKRRDEDISAVACAFAVSVEEGRITSARLAYGGMAGIPARAARAEAALVGQALDAGTFERAATAMAGDFTPLDDARASAAYRRTVAQNLLRRFWLAQPEAQVFA